MSRSPGREPKRPAARARSGAPRRVSARAGEPKPERSAKPSTPVPAAALETPAPDPHAVAELEHNAAETVARIVAQLQPSGEDAPDADGVLGTAKQLLSGDYYVRRLSRLGLRGRGERVDDFGYDAAYEAHVRPLLDALYERYFRVRVHGHEHVPERGGALLVCNRSGALPWDGVMLKLALSRTRPERGALRWLTDDFVSHAAFLGAALNRLGAVRACPENAEQLLERGELVAVFPEGIKGIEKPYAERYRLQRFGRGGHVKLALRLRVPIVPVAIVGGEETYPLLYRVRAFSKAFGMPFIPVTPTFPWLGPLGLLPLPSRWHIELGEPFRELDGLDASVADDVTRVNELNERLRARVQSLLREGLSARGPSAFT